MKNSRKILIAAAITLLLPACTSVKRELGVGRNSPDEFAVVKRAPLTLPPEYSLRPPATPGEAPSAAATTQSAKAALLGGMVAPAEKGNGDNAFLGRMGADAADPGIRKVIDEENGYLSLANRSVADKLIHWDDEEATPSLDNAPSSVVDPVAEAERLKQNAATGKPVNDGKVPTIEKKKGTIDKIF